MGECNIDHSPADVKKKFESQKPYLPEDVKAAWPGFLNRDLTQDKLNEAFHLLKKYDLAAEDERKKRDLQMKHLLGIS